MGMGMGGREVERSRGREVERLEGRRVGGKVKK